MTTKKTDFKALQAELDDVVQKLQGEVALDEALKLYERGLELTAAIEKYLDEAENTITRLGEKFGV